MNQRPTVLDLFSGVGGLSLGFEQAGFDVAAAIELDPIHAAVHHYNFPYSETICGSVTSIEGAEVLERVGKPIDVVVGGAPCQGFSLIGQRALDDPRNQLIKHFLRLVLELKPSYFVFENVKGLTLGQHRKFLDELEHEFQRNGYHTVRPWRVLDAKDFGVPQNRQRLFVIGAREGSPLPAYPEECEKPVTCRDALDDLPDAETFQSLLDLDSVRTKRWGPMSFYAREMRGIGNDSWRFGYPREWEFSVLTSSMRTDHTEISRRRFAETEPGKVEPVSRFFKLAPHGVSNTLRAGTDSARGAFTSPRPIHYKYNRCVTVREMARLHGFPDWFRFHATKWHGARQIGNAVPPPLARAVAKSLLEAMNSKPSRPNRVVSLGDEKLLRMDMKAASAYWGVEVPIGRRNKKSGAKKRKQHEVEAERNGALLNV